MKLSINTTITVSLSKSLMGGSINFAQNMMFTPLFENNTWIAISLVSTLHPPLPQGFATKPCYFQNNCLLQDLRLYFSWHYHGQNPNFLLSKGIKFSTMCYISFGQTCKKLSCTSSSITIYSKNVVQYLHVEGKQNPQNLTCLIQIVDWKYLHNHKLSYINPCLFFIWKGNMSIYPMYTMDYHCTYLSTSWI
jgi:hypothetical protein